MKKHNAILFACILLTVTSLTFSFSHWLACQSPGPMTPERLKDSSYLAKKLSLSQEQKNTIDALNDKLIETMNRCCVNNCIARQQLAQALANQQSEKIEAILMIMCQTYDENERATLQHIKALRNLLDDHQKSQFDKLLSACVCGECKTKPNQRQNGL